MRDANIVSGDAVRCFGWKATLEIKLNCCCIIAFSFFHFSCFGLLVSFEQPLEVVIFEFTNILVFEFLSNFNWLVPSVKFLVHCHSLFNFVVLNQNCLCFVELFIEYCKLCLNSKVVCSFLSNQLVQLAKIIRSRHVTESSITSFSHVEVLLFQSKLSQSFPVCFSLRSDSKWL